MVQKKGLIILSIIFICLLLSVCIAGCKGSDTRKETDEVIEEMTGKKNLERMKRMEQNIDQIEKDQKRHYDQLDP